MAAGELSRKIRIQKRAAGKDSLNRPNGAWETVLTLWSQPRGSTGMGTIRAAEQGAPVNVNQYSFRIRYRPDGLDIGMRVMYLEDGVPSYHEVIAIKHDLDRRAWTDIVCQTGGSDG